MNRFKQSLAAALRADPIDLDAFDEEEAWLLTKVKVLAVSVETLTEELVDAKAQDVIIQALCEREARRLPAVSA